MSDTGRISTEELLALLFKERSLEHFFKTNEEACRMPSFSDYLNAWCRERGEVPEQVIRRANLEKSFGHQLWRGTRNPSRDTVLKLALAMEADFSGAQEMLRLARHSQLYPRIRRDAAVIYCLHKHISLVDAQIILQDLGLPLLGGRET